MKKHSLTLLLIFSGLQLFCQTPIIDPIVDTAANYTDNIAYNTGEVFVVFTIQNQTIVSKNEEEITANLQETNSSDISINEEEITANLQETNSSKDISIYPNPTTDFIEIKTSKDTLVTKVMLYSMDGRLIFEKEVSNNQVDLSNLPVGSYLLKTDFDTTTTFKIIKR